MQQEKKKNPQNQENPYKATSGFFSKRKDFKNKTQLYTTYRQLCQLQHFRPKTKECKEIFQAALYFLKINELL